MQGTSPIGGNILLHDSALFAVAHTCPPPPPLSPTLHPFLSAPTCTHTHCQLQLPQVKGSRKLNHQQKPPPLPSPVVFSIRPYRSEDKELLYRTCLETGDNGGDASNIYANYPNLLGDRYACSLLEHYEDDLTTSPSPSIPPPPSLRFVGPYVELCREFSFVLEDSQGVCGYVLAALDSELFYRRFKEEWLPKILPLYPTPLPGSKPSPEVVSERVKMNKLLATLSTSLLLCPSPALHRIYSPSCITCSFSYHDMFSVTIPHTCTLT